MAGGLVQDGRGSAKDLPCRAVLQLEADGRIVESVAARSGAIRGIVGWEIVDGFWLTASEDVVSPHHSSGSFSQPSIPNDRLLSLGLLPPGTSGRYEQHSVSVGRTSADGCSCPQPRETITSDEF